MGSSTVQVLSYNMEGFLKSSVELYVELFLAAPSMSSASSVRVASPCTPETHEHAPVAIPSPGALGADKSEGGLTGGDDQGGVDPAGSAAKNFNTAAARVIMKVMYAAGMARPDLSMSIAYLAWYLTKWTNERTTTSFDGIYQ